MADRLTLSLDLYQAANLRWLLQVVGYCPPERYPSLNNGDWVAEITVALEQLMIEADVTTSPNVYDEWAKKPLEGEYGGLKKVVYEKERAEGIVDRIQKLLVLKNISDEVKFRIIEETVKGWWGIEHAKALERG